MRLHLLLSPEVLISKNKFLITITVKSIQYWNTIVLKFSPNLC
jgi:hypothetical protein